MRVGKLQNFVWIFSQRPEYSDWVGGVNAMKVALQLEKNVNQALLDLHQVADSKEDVQVSDQISARITWE